MAFALESLHLLLLLSLSTCCLSSTTSTVKPHRLVSKLIHPASVHHPHYKPNQTAKDRMELDMQHSASRLAYIQARIEGSLASNNDYTANARPSLTGRTMLANISVGHPPISQLVIVDTASDVFWIMCSPCSNCDHHLGMIFDPSKSSTYSPWCNKPCGFKGCRCDPITFSISYVDRSSASGTYGRDKVTFETSDEGISQKFGVLFGCGHSIEYNKDPGYNGIVGLNSAPFSLASQIGHKFSYCIGNLADKYYSYNQLILGEGADLEGYPTPFEEHYGFYYVTLVGISVGEKRLDIAPGTFDMKKDGNGGVILDTGCTITYLVDVVHTLLYNEVKQIIGDSLRHAVPERVPWMLCYVGRITRDLVGFPAVTFHLAEGADLVLDSGSLFHQFDDDLFCMIVAPVNELENNSKPSVIGLLAQQNYNIGYDLVNEFIYFQRIDCELLSG